MAIPNLPGQNILQRWAGVSQNIIQAVQNASKRTGVSFDYLMSKAKQESSFNPDAKAGTSSASVLFDFIDSRWLHAVRSYGDQVGLGHLARQISVDSKGRAVVSDPQVKKQILEMRTDPQAAANMTAAMTRDNAEYLKNSLGGKVGENELYLAHFMGLGGADKFLKARQENPYQHAADLFPAAAKANKNVFYDASGRKKSLDEVYDFFAKKFNPTGEQNAGPVTLVSAGGSQARTVALPALMKPAGMGFTVPLDVGQIEAELNAQLGQRQMIESLLSGMNNFGFKRDTDTHGKTSNLVAPYTSYILAQLHSPAQQDRAHSQSHGRDGKTS